MDEQLLKRSGKRPLSTKRHDQRIVERRKGGERRRAFHSRRRKETKLGKVGQGSEMIPEKRSDEFFGGGGGRVKSWRKRKTRIMKIKNQKSGKP